MHEGHRKRIIERLSRDEGGLRDHELLEILLFNAIPRKNTNDIAHRLIHTFGSLSGVLRASVSELERVEGVGHTVAAYLRIFSLLREREFFEENEGSAKDVYNFENFRKFLFERFSGLLHEEVVIYALSGKGEMQGMRAFTLNKKNRVSFEAAAFNEFISSTHPVGVIIAHNHIDSSSEPSEADNDFTKQMLMLCALNGIRLYDHVIVSGGEAFSYQRSGVLEEMEKHQILL